MLASPRIAIAGAGMSGLCMAAKLKHAGIHDFTVYEKADEVGGTWRENTYPGPDLRRALALLLVLLRAQPELDAPLRAGRGDPGLLHPRLGGARRARPHPLRLRGHERALGGRPLAPAHPGRARGRGRRAGLRHRRAAPPAHAGDRGARDVRGRLLPLGALGPLGSARGPSRGGRRNGLDRSPDRLRAGRSRRAAARLPAHGPVDPARAQHALLAGHALAVRALPGPQPPRLPLLPGDARARARQGRDEAGLAAPCDQPHLPPQPALRREGPAAAPAAAPGLPADVQAPRDVRGLLPRDAEARAWSS